MINLSFTTTSIVGTEMPTHGPSSRGPLPEPHADRMSADSCCYARGRASSPGIGSDGTSCGPTSSECSAHERQMFLGLSGRIHRSIVRSATTCFGFRFGRAATELAQLLHLNPELLFRPSAAHRQAGGNLSDLRAALARPRAGYRSLAWMP